MHAVRTSTAVAAVALAATLAACSSNVPTKATPDRHATRTASSGSGATTPVAVAHTHVAPVNPLTGGVMSHNPVVAVKIDDTAAGRPQVGVDRADIVYIEEVEGGLTRLLAVFDTSLPTVEPVRSTRANDPQLALEYGHIDYVASGGDRPELAPLFRSPLRRDLDGSGPGFQRDPSRVAPENLRADLAAVAHALHGPPARDIGLTWSRAVPPGSAAGTDVRTTVGATPVEFRWQPALHRYVRVIDGQVQHVADGRVIATPNVVVQFCRITTYWRDRDVLGNPAYWTHTVGSGPVVVYRDGRRITGTWHRPRLDAGTRLLDAHGHAIPLAPGGAWFVLARRGTPLR